jgi:hypothetical protein
VRRGIVYLCWIRPAEESSWGVRDERSEDWRTATAAVSVWMIQGELEGTRTAARCLQTESLGNHCECVIDRVKVKSKVVHWYAASHTPTNPELGVGPIAAASPTNQSASPNYPSFHPLQNLRFPISFLAFFLSIMGPGPPSLGQSSMIYRWLL